MNRWEEGADVRDVYLDGAGITGTGSSIHYGAGSMLRAALIEPCTPAYTSVHKEEKLALDIPPSW